MFKSLKKMFGRQAAEPVYQLPSDDPELNPILVTDESPEPGLDEIASLNSQLLVPAIPDNPGAASARSRAIVEMKTGLQDLGTHIRSLGQRLHAQSMAQAKLVDALSTLPQTLKEIIPNGEEQTRVMAALKLSMDAQSASHEKFVESLKPLPQFIESAATLPEAAKRQMQVIESLTSQLRCDNRNARQQSEQVKVMVESMADRREAGAVKVEDGLRNLNKVQRAQLRQAALAVKSSELARRSQRRHHADLEKRQGLKLEYMRRNQSQRFGRMEVHFRQSARRQTIMTGAAVLLAVLALVFAVLVSTGTLQLGGAAAPQAAAQPDDRGGTDSAHVSR